MTVTTQLHQEEVESSDDVQMIEQIEQIEQIETEIEEEETEEETVFTLDLTDDSECEDKEYLGERCPVDFHFLLNSRNCFSSPQPNSLACKRRAHIREDSFAICAARNSNTLDG